MSGQLSLPLAPRQQALAPGLVLLSGFALADEDVLVAAIHDVSTSAPFRHMITPGGFRMSAAMTNCGALGWTSDRSGYRYSAVDPITHTPWPAMPPSFASLATRAAEAAQFGGFTPDACLVNRYAVGARLTLHEDADERDFDQPIVSVSLGLPATFLWGGARRRDTPRRIPIVHGDVLVWGGASRRFFHGVSPIRAGSHPQLGDYRINLTFRRAG